MRIINADKLINQIERHCINDEVLYKDDVIEIINNAPTVIPEDFMNPYEEGYEKARKEFERSTGEWKEQTDERWGGTTIYCPYCKEEALEKCRDGLCRQVKSRFCPNCGARMEDKK